MRGQKVKFSVRIHQGGVSYDSLKRIWTEADRLGYHSATLYDLLNVATLECWTTLTSLAAVTERIRLTPLVLANLYRHPALLAKMASTLDVISGGRLELGIGAGGGEGDHLALGIPFPPTPVRVGMLEEAVDIIKRLWGGGEIDFKGHHYTVNRAINDPPPVQRPHPPILIGGHGETHLMRATAKYADICNIGFEMSVQEHKAKLEVLERHCRKLGRDPAEIEVSHNTRVMIAETEAEFDRLVARMAGRSGATSGAYRASLSGAIAGTPERCVEHLRRYVENGITYFFLLFPDPISSESLSLFATEVMPHFSMTPS